MEAISFTLGTIVAKWVLQLWTKDSALEDLGPDLIDLVSRKFSGRREQRKVSRQFESIADTVAERLEPYLSHEIAGADEGEIVAAARAVEETLSSAAISSQRLIELNLDQSQLLADLESRSQGALERNKLSEEGRAIFSLLLAESASFAVAVVAKLPEFGTAHASALLVRDTQIIELVNDVLNRMPISVVPASWGVGSEDQRFENKYRQAIHGYADRLHIFGVTSETARKTYPLSVAYISMAVSTASTKKATLLDAALEEKDKLHGDTLGQASAHGNASDEENDSIRVDAALAAQYRCVISGDAGSGKTTLLQWLTVYAARKSFTGDLADWNGLIPFVIPLRRYAGRRLPMPNEFFEETAPLLCGAMPQSWAHRMMAEGRALVLIDGLDEIPSGEREDARRWLESLAENFPRNRFIVTSRSSALSRSWLKLEGFVQNTLLPMDYPDIKAFIVHWHAAAVSGAAPGEEAATIKIQEKSLVSAVRDRPAIRALCTSPLLCALICALNRDRQGSLPDNRMDLYATALQMLIVRRDEERQLRSSEGLVLTYNESLILLQGFALWLHENGLADASRSDFEGQIARQLPHLHRINSSGDVVAAHLLIRSGVLREPSPGRVDFVHKTFLEYLAAAALINENSIEKLLRHASDAHWRDVIVMSAGHATSEARERLLKGLISKGRENSRYKHRLWLLAISCMETAPELSTELQKSLRQCLDNVIPPTNMTEARAVASAGELAVQVLGGRRDSAKNTAATVRTLALIGGEAAMDALTFYSTDKRKTVARELIRGWVSFDPESYARRILHESPLVDGHIRVTDPDLLPHLADHPNLRSLELDTVGRSFDMSSIPASIPLQTLVLGHAREVDSLHHVAKFTSLRKLFIHGAEKLVSTTGLESVIQLNALALRNCTNLEDVSALQGLSSLGYLDLSGTAVARLEDFSPDQSLSILRLAWCRNLQSLGDEINSSHLELGHNDSLKDYGAISRSSVLRSLRLFSPQVIGDSFKLPTKLRTLEYYNDDGPMLPLTGGDSLVEFAHYGATTAQEVKFLIECPTIRSITIDIGSDISLIPLLSMLTEKDSVESLYVFVNSEIRDQMPVIDGFESGGKHSLLGYWRSS